MALISKAFSDIITFSRSSNATRVGPDGTVQYAPHNLLTYSEQFDNVAWNQSSLTVTTNAAAAPNGTATADKLIANTTNTYHQVSELVTTVASVVYAFSVYLKMGESRYANLLVNNNGGFSAIGVDMQAGAIVTNSVAVTQAVGSIQSVGNGWYRVTVFVQAASTSIDFRITASNSANTSWSFAGDGSSGFYAWGAQVSAGSIAGDYTPTTSAAVYGPRFDYDPVTLAAKGLLIEEQRTNVATYSEAFDNAAWTKGNSSISANAVTAPDGTTTADKLVEDTATTGHVVYQSFVGSAASYTASVFVKSAGRSLIAIRFDDASTLSTSYFDLSTGTVAASGTGATCSITPVGNGWYRCSVTRTLTVATYYFLLSPALTTSSNSYTGDGSSGLYLWGAQIEAGAFATSYIPTVASTVTRSADVASVNTLSPWFNATEGTLYTETASQGNNRIAWLHNTSTGTYDNFLYIVLTSGLNARSEVNVSGVSQASMITANAASALTTAKIALRYKANDFAVCLNAGAVVTDTSGNVPTVDRLQIGWHTDNVYLNGHIRRLVYYPRRLTNAELQALTA